MDNILIEICTGSAEDCQRAEVGGADRIELNSALFLGGLTPSIGTMTIARKLCHIPIMAMVRPRAGGFCYTECEIDAMECDARMLINSGADGIVFGFLNADGTVDGLQVKCFARLAHSLGAQAVFSRAIDVVPDWKAALDVLIDANVDRVLTSGQMPSAPLGLDIIGEMIKYAHNRIEILPGAGINARNIHSVIDATGCTQVHMSAKGHAKDTSCIGNTAIHFGGALYPPEDIYDVTDSDAVAGIKSML